MMKPLRAIRGICRAASPLALLGLVACGGGSGDTTDTTTPNGDQDVVIPQANDDTDPLAACGIADLNRWVDAAMHDYYFYHDQVPAADPAKYESPEALIRDLRVAPDTYSYVTSAQAFDDVAQAGRDFGLGYQWRRDPQGRPRIATVQRFSPFGRAGVQRGDTIVSVNGIDWNELSTADFYAFIGDRDAPLAATWRFVDGETGEIVDHDITQASYDIVTVPYISAIIFPSGTRAGYLVVSRFESYTLDELDFAFDYFREQNVTELIVDFRYNGGGRSSVARQLASKIAGASRAGDVMYTRRFNDTYQNDNLSFEFSDEANALALSRVLFLTTDSTASASEIVINSLAPYMDVVTLGMRTVGKPFGSFPEYKCDRVMFAMTYIRENSLGVDVAGGIPPVCDAVDRVERPYGLNDGDPESMLAAALDYLEDGACSAPQLADGPRSGARPVIGDRQGIRPPPGDYD